MLPRLDLVAEIIYVSRNHVNQLLPSCHSPSSCILAFCIWVRAPRLSVPGHASKAKTTFYRRLRDVSTTPIGQETYFTARSIFCSTVLHALQLYRTSTYHHRTTIRCRISHRSPFDRTLDRETLSKTLQSLSLPHPPSSTEQYPDRSPTHARQRLSASAPRLSSPLSHLTTEPTEGYHSREPWYCSASASLRLAPSAFLPPRHLHVGRKTAQTPRSERAGVANLLRRRLPCLSTSRRDMRRLDRQERMSDGDLSAALFRPRAVDEHPETDIGQSQSRLRFCCCLIRLEPDSALPPTASTRPLCTMYSPCLGGCTFTALFMYSSHLDDHHVIPLVNMDDSPQTLLVVLGPCRSPMLRQLLRRAQAQSGKACDSRRPKHRQKKRHRIRTRARRIGLAAANRAFQWHNPHFARS